MTRVKMKAGAGITTWIPGKGRVRYVGGEYYDLNKIPKEYHEYFMVEEGTPSELIKTIKQSKPKKSGCKKC